MAEIDGIRICHSKQGMDSGTSHFRCYTAGACFSEGVNSESRQLFQRYFVDQFCEVEAERLSYLLQDQQSHTALRKVLGCWGGLNDESEAV